jgi:hypothetical protein
MPHVEAILLSSGSRNIDMDPAAAGREIGVSSAMVCSRRRLIESEPQTLLMVVQGTRSGVRHKWLLGGWGFALGRRSDVAHKDFVDASGIGLPLKCFAEGDRAQSGSG